MAKVMGTVKSIIGEATATAPDGTVRKLQVGDQVFTDDVISTSATGSVQIALAGGQTLECGNDSSIAMSDYVIGSGVNVALTAPPVTPPAGTDVSALQAAIAAGADPSQVADATAAGGAPGAGGGPDGGGGRSVVVIEQGNNSVDVTSGFNTSGSSIDFPTPEPNLLPEVESESPPIIVSVSVQVEVQIDPDNPPPDGGGGIINVSGNAVDVLEGTNDGNTSPVTFNIVLSAASDGPVQVTYTIMAGTATNPDDFQAVLTDTVIIPAGETSFPVTVFIEQDHLVEGTETFTIVLSDAVGAVINPDADTVFVNIIDDDHPPVANHDTNWVQEDSDKQVAAGNVLQSQAHPDDPSEVLNFADVADTDSNVEEVLMVTSVNGSAANVGVAIVGTYGTLVLNADGSYTYTLNNGDPLVQALGPQDLVTDSFQYTITDGFNNGLESATLTITIFGGNDGPVVQTPDPARVSEEGLVGGIPDTSGNLDLTNSTTISGQILASDADGDALTFTLNAPVDALFSNGVQIVWSGDGTDTLVGTAGGDTIVTITIDNDGNYEVVLSGKVDHGDTVTEDQLTFNVGVSVSDGEEVTNTALTVVVEDDSPTFTNVADGPDEGTAVSVSAPNPDADTTFNVQLADWSFGADGPGGIPTLSNVTGNISVSGASTSDALILELKDAGGNLVATLTLNADGTDSLEVLHRATTFDTDVLLTGDVTASGPASEKFILSSIEGLVITVTASGGNALVNPSTQGWAVGDNQIDVNEAIQFSFNQSVEQFSFSTTGFTGNPGTIGLTIRVYYDEAHSVFQDFADVFVAQNGTIHVTDLDGFGMDGAFSSFYGVNVLSDSAHQDGNDGFRLNNVTISKITGTPPEDLAYNFTLSLVDGDGDTAAQSFAVVLSGDSGDLVVEAIVGTSGDDILVGTSDDDILISGAGSDTLTGDTGSDTFKWQAGDGDAVTPAVDTVTDWTNGDNVLDLADLLQGENSGNLTDYLSFSWDGANTTITVKSTGSDGVVDQQIVLQGVDITSSNSLTTSQIITNLMDQSKLVTD